MSSIDFADAFASVIDGWTSERMTAFNEDEKVDDFAHYIFPGSSSSNAEHLEMPSFDHHHDGHHSTDTVPSRKSILKSLNPDELVDFHSQSELAAEAHKEELLIFLKQVFPRGEKSATRDITVTPEEALTRFMEYGVDSVCE